MRLDNNMYRSYDKKEAIREIQRYLYKLSFKYDFIPRVSIDGIYAETTRNAVAFFQRNFGLNVNGIVNNKTFSQLYEKYSEANRSEKFKNLMPQKERFPLKRGDFGNDILYLNLMIDELRSVFDNVTDVKLSPLFSYNTERAVIDLRDAFGLLGDGVVDEILFERMEKELDLRYEFD